MSSRIYLPPCRRTPSLRTLVPTGPGPATNPVPLRIPVKWQLSWYLEKGQEAQPFWTFVTTWLCQYPIWETVWTFKTPTTCLSHEGGMSNVYDATLSQYTPSPLFLRDDTARLFRSHKCTMDNLILLNIGSPQSSSYLH